MLVLLALAVAGQGVRYFLTNPGEPPGQVQLLGALEPGSPTAQRDSAMRQARPLGPGERVNADLAPASELARLPRIGLRLAKVIVADRESHGPFGSLSGLDRVSGVGPGLLKIIGPHVVFSQSAGPAVPSQPTATLDLNAASITELDALPGIGPAKAAAILQYREQHGPFASIDELERVPGFGPSAVSRLRSRLIAR
jgi:competence protein ComEA